MNKVTELRFRVQIQPENSPVPHKKLAVPALQRTLLQPKKITKAGVSFPPGINNAYGKATSFFLSFCQCQSKISWFLNSSVL